MIAHGTTARWRTAAGTVWIGLILGAGGCGRGADAVPTHPPAADATTAPGGAGAATGMPAPILEAPATAGSSGTQVAAAAGSVVEFALAQPLTVAVLVTPSTPGATP